MARNNKNDYSGNTSMVGSCEPRKASGSKGMPKAKAKNTGSIGSKKANKQY